MVGAMVANIERNEKIEFIEGLAKEFCHLAFSKVLKAERVELSRLRWAIDSCLLAAAKLIVAIAKASPPTWEKEIFGTMVEGYQETLEEYCWKEKEKEEADDD